MIMKRLAILALFLITILTTFSQTSSSSGFGNGWCDSDSWVRGTLPNVTKGDIIINNGDSISADCEPNVITFGSKSTLIIQENAILVLNDVEFSNGSTILISEGGSFIINGNLLNKNNSTNITVDGNLTVNGTLTNGNKGEIGGNGVIYADTVVGACCIMGYEPDLIPSNSEISLNDGIVALPIELLYFNGKYLNNNVILEWSTSNEVNNDYFIVHKSVDGYSFIEFDTIKGSGNSAKTKHYIYNDNKPYIGSNYYKLEQVDYNGNTEEFTTIHIEYNPTVFNTYYNNSKITIKNDNNRGNAILVIYDIKGEIKYYVNFYLEIGYTTFDIDNLSSGAYIINLITKTDLKQKKFVIK